MPLIGYRMEDVLMPMPDDIGFFPSSKIRDVVVRMEQALVFTNRHGAEDFINPIIIVEFQVREPAPLPVPHIEPDVLSVQGCP